MLLSILIPTYNRSKSLLKNLYLLEKQILSNNLKEEINIVISNNMSSDNTDEVVCQFKNQTQINIEYYVQKCNIGLEKNLLFTLSVASSTWVMLLGDDDYIDDKYIANVVHNIKTNSKLYCIVPNYIGIEEVSGRVIYERESNAVRTNYPRGFESCLRLSWMAHQLSGLVFVRQDVLKEYNSRKISNLYPQIFMLSFNILRGDALYLPEYPVRVTFISQDRKDWNYGEDGLMNDICENYKKLHLTYGQRARLEAMFNFKERRYLWAYKKNTNQCVDNILRAKNISLLGKYYIARQILIDKCYTGVKSKPFMFFVVCISYMLKIKKYIISRR